MKNIFYCLILSICLISSKILAKPSHLPKVSHVNHYQKIGSKAFTIFQDEALSDNKQQIDFLFLKLEKKINFKTVNIKNMLIEFDFNVLTEDVSSFLNNLNSRYSLAVNSKLRHQLQLEFYGLSQTIKKANEINLSVDADYFDRLHDSLVSQSTSLFYASYKDSSKLDLFFSSYYLNELKFPEDLTAKHVIALQKKRETEALRIYLPKVSRVALQNGQQINKLNSNELEALYLTAIKFKLNNYDEQSLQKIYLKQLQTLGDQEKIKSVKKSLAANLLAQESKNIIYRPWEIFKFLQFLVGYIFVAWPLEVILIICSLLIFTFQSSSVLTVEEKKRNSFIKRLWIMFTKAYLGNNVPFFSKLAASLILFGVGLYFNSARNFVESLMASMN